VGKQEYANRRIEDPFLRQLADGGFQVGALARLYFPEGILVETPNDEAAVMVTEQYLEQENVTLFEAGVRFGSFLIRADVVVKTGNELKLYEVKAKSADFDDDSAMFNKNGTISSTWKPYVEDVAFQKYVIANAHPDLTVQAHLMLADKRRLCPTDGLNQKFRLVRQQGRRRVHLSEDLGPADLDPRLLTDVNVDNACGQVSDSLIGDRRFDEHLEMLAEHYSQDQKIVPQPSSACKDCEFRTVDGEKILRSGYRECWTESLGWTDDEEFQAPTVLEIWDLRGKDKFIADGKIRFADLVADDIKPKPDGKPGISRTERQWMQVELGLQKAQEPFIDGENLLREMDSWKFPLHFIDFETCKPVIPFLRQRTPYEEVVFQFSHHTIDDAGHIEHAGEFLLTTPGIHPNFDFVRELKRQLESDDGTIFKYTSFENTVLSSIRSKLIESLGEVEDAQELCEFIESISQPTGKQAGAWNAGPRNMVDLCDLVKRYYYDPGTKGSNSLKYVLPAMLNSSAFLKGKYSEPLYGTDAMPSRNYNAQRWIDYDADGRVRDPYTLLPMLFTDETANDYAAIMEMDKIKDGGAAMTAYGKLQFEDIPPEARQSVESALLKYCELDTLAMVMIYEAWRAAL